MRKILLILVALLWLPGAGEACSFHTYLPERTVIDRLLETENVVLARPATDNPFRFEAVQALEGTLEQADLPTLVDSTTRRRLALNPQDAVLFARDGGAYGPFVRLAYVDSDLREVVATIMERKQDWVMGDDLARYQYFADLLSHPSPRLRNLALRELDKASYDIFHALDLAPSAGPILQEMWRKDQIALQPIRILLLGLSEDPEALAALRSGLERAHDGVNTKTFGPYATAFVEQTGADGVAYLADSFLLDRTLERDALELGVEALAIHAGAGTASLREEILATLATVVETRPDMADMVARQFFARYDFGMADALQRLMQEGKITSAITLIPVSSYVGTANASQQAANTNQ